jgi:large subunit ribosomal protein L6
MLKLVKKNYKPVSCFYNKELNLFFVKGFLGFCKVEFPFNKLKFEIITDLTKFSFSVENKGSLDAFKKAFKRALIGVSYGWFISLEVVGRGFSIELAQNKLLLNVGFSHAFCILLDPGFRCFLDVQKKTSFVLFNKDYQQLKNLSCRIKALKPINPYKGSGIRYLGESIKLKQGKKNTN